MIIDQPSQVYFPSTAAYKQLDGTKEEFGDLQPDDADISAVGRMFKALYDIVGELSPNFQIIVTEHANLPESWFQESLVDHLGGRKSTHSSGMASVVKSHDKNLPRILGVTAASCLKSFSKRSLG